MSETKEMTQAQEKTVAKAEAQGRPEVVLRPAVDVYETKEGVTLKADLPGVSPETLDVKVDNEELVIEGSVNLDVPDKMEARYAEIQSSRYRRSFSLSSDLDIDKVEAELKNGVLTLHIPKREELKPRKITVSAG